MKKIVSVVLLVSLLVLMVVGCSENEVMERTITIKNESDINITGLYFTIKYGSIPRLSGPTTILEAGGILILPLVYNSDSDEELDATIEVAGFNTGFTQLFGKTHYFSFLANSTGNVTLTVRVEDGDLTITGSGSGYIECPIN